MSYSEYCDFKSGFGEVQDSLRVARVSLRGAIPYLLRVIRLLCRSAALSLFSMTVSRRSSEEGNVWHCSQPIF
jgi:hypothetical protein